MADLNKKFSIDSWDEWFVVSKWVDNQIQATEEELLNQLVELPDSFLAKLQDKKLANKKEQFEQLKPAWFEHASQKAKKYRQELEAKWIQGDEKAVKEMEHLSEILAYNSDNTVGLPTINETFCADLAWWKSMNREASMEVAKSKWYHLLSDWNDNDSEADKKETDWYRLENLFWEYANQWALFCMLDFDNDRYWTSTKYENEEGVVRYRTLYKTHCFRDWTTTHYNDRVCGFKDSM